MTFTIDSNQRDPVRVRLNPGETVRLGGWPPVPDA
jgi:hypothetical protein